MDTIIFYQPLSTMAMSKPKKIPQGETFPMLDDDIATLEIVDLTGLTVDSYN